MLKEGKRLYRPLFFRVFTITLALVWSASINAQDDNLDLSFENAPLNQIILDIEAKSGYRFFFIEDWLQDKNVSISLYGAGLSEVLDALLADSDLRPTKPKSSREIGLRLLFLLKIRFERIKSILWSVLVKRTIMIYDPSTPLRVGRPTVERVNRCRIWPYG